MYACVKRWIEKKHHNPSMIWVNLITTSLFSRSLESWFYMGNNPQKALFQISELFQFTQMHVFIDGDLLGPSERISTMGLMAINHVPTFWTIANNYEGCPYMEVPQ